MITGIGKVLFTAKEKNYQDKNTFKFVNLKNVFNFTPDSLIMRLNSP